MFNPSPSFPHSSYSSNTLLPMNPSRVRLVWKSNLSIQEENAIKDESAQTQSHILHATSKQIQVPRRALALSIERPLSSQREFFLQNDMFIEFNNLDEDGAFQAFKELSKSFRPVQRIHQLKSSRFLAIDFDQTNRGLNFFNPIIHQLNSMQDLNLHILATKLQEHSDLINRFANNQQQRVRLSSKNMEIFNKFRNQEVPTILSRFNPHDLYSYSVFQCVEDMLNATCVSSGANENLIRLLGSDINAYTQLILRQGWFDMLCFRGRNEQSMEFIEVMNTLLRNNVNFSELYLNNRIQFITLDGIKGTANIEPELFFCFGEDRDENYPHMNMMIGYMYICKMNVDEETKKRIIVARENRSIITPSEQLYEDPQKSMQHFYYNCESQIFKDFARKHEQKLKVKVESKSAEDIARTCKIRIRNPSTFNSIIVNDNPQKAADNEEMEIEPPDWNHVESH